MGICSFSNSRNRVSMYPSPPLCGSNKLRMSSVEYTLCELRGRGLYPRGPSLPAVLSAVAGRPAWSRRANTCMAVSGNERSRLSRQLCLFFLAYQGQTLAKSDWLLSNTPSSVFYYKSLPFLKLIIYGFPRPYVNVLLNDIGSSELRTSENGSQKMDLFHFGISSYRV